jgi:hypothetical protein
VGKPENVNGASRGALTIIISSVNIRATSTLIDPAAGGFPRKKFQALRVDGCLCALQNEMDSGNSNIPVSYLVVRR